MMKDLFEWALSHPGAFVAVFAVAISTVLDRWIVYYGDDYPRKARVFRYLIDLLSFLPSRGHQLRRGLKLPLLATSGRPPAPPEVSP